MSLSPATTVPPDLPVGHVAALQLRPDGAEDGVLVVRIAEDGALVGLQLAFQFPDEVEVREVVLLVVEVLPGMLDGTVLVDDVVRELKGNLLVGGHARIEG